LEIDEDTPNHVVKTELIHDLIHSANIEDNWKEFELRFQNVHSDFYRQLRERFANLTTNEIRLAALLRLNMNTKEISAITHQTERAVVLSRHRLRQKLGLQRNLNGQIVAATSHAGTNSYNKIYADTLVNTTGPVMARSLLFLSPSSAAANGFFDEGNEIGVEGGNVFLNNNVASFSQQRLLKVANNLFTSNDGILV
jgi:hypothetical protein